MAKRTTKAPKAKATKADKWTYSKGKVRAAEVVAYRPPAGLDEKATDRFIDDAESLDRGLPRYPWGDAFKAKVKAAIEGQRDIPDCQTVINRMVVGELGAGIHGRGPFA